MEEQTLLDIAQHIPLLSELAPVDLMQILDAGRSLRLPKNSLIFQEGEEYRGFYIVVTGTVKIFKMLPDGTETVLHLQAQHQTLAEIPMFVGGGYPANAMTVEDSHLLFIAKEAFLDCLRGNPSLALKMLAGLSKRLRAMGAQMEKLQAMDVRTRLVRFLRDELAGQNDASPVPVVTLPVSKTLLAAQLGVALETLSRTFKKLEKEGLLRVQGRNILIDDPERLRRIALEG